MGDLRLAQGRPKEARLAYVDAIAVIDTIAASLTDEQLRSTFLTSKPIEGIRRSGAE